MLEEAGFSHYASFPGERNFLARKFLLATEKCLLARCDDTGEMKLLLFLCDYSDFLFHDIAKIS